MQELAIGRLRHRPTEGEFHLLGNVTHVIG